MANIAAAPPKNVGVRKILPQGTFGCSSPVTAALACGPFAYGPSFHVASHSPHQATPVTARMTKAGRQPQAAMTKARTGATAILAMDEPAVIQAPGRPRFSGGCHE